MVLGYIALGLVMGVFVGFLISELIHDNDKSLKEKNESLEKELKKLKKKLMHDRKQKDPLKPLFVGKRSKS
jgi:uncharacterized membrane-anchored protein YhcB (DUF1043 family)